MLAKIVIYSMCTFPVFFDANGKARKADDLDREVIDKRGCWIYNRNLPCVKSITLLPDGNRQVKCEERTRVKGI